MQAQYTVARHASYIHCNARYDQIKSVTDLGKGGGNSDEGEGETDSKPLEDTVEIHQVVAEMYKLD